MFTCSVCKRDFFPKRSSLRIIENQKYPKCDECHYARKATVSLASANKKAQTEIMGLEDRVLKLEKENKMLSTIVESIVFEKTQELISDFESETQLKLKQMQAQIIALNNKMVNKND